MNVTNDFYRNANNLHSITICALFARLFSENITSDKAAQIKKMLNFIFIHGFRSLSHFLKCSLNIRVAYGLDALIIIINTGSRWTLYMLFRLQMYLDISTFFSWELQICQLLANPQKRFYFTCWINSHEISRTQTKSQEYINTISVQELI